MKLEIVTDRVVWPPRADYITQVDESAKLIRIIDQDSGNMSVTNDLDRVLIEVAGQIDGPLDGYSITYRDTLGTWDRIVVTPHKVLAHTFNVEVRPGPGPGYKWRDPLPRP